MSSINILLRKLNNFPKDSQDFQNARLINVLLILMMLTLLLFTCLDVFKFSLLKIATTNFVGFLLSSFVFIYFHLTKNVRFSAILTVMLVAVITLFSIIQQAPDFHIVVWMYAVPPVAFFLLGIKKGLLISVIFGFILEIFFFIRNFVSEGPEHIMNISIAYIVLIFFIMQFERSRDKAFKLLLIDIERRKRNENEIKKLNEELEIKVLQRTKQLQDLNDILNEEIVIRKEAEEASDRARSEAEEANKVKSEFLSRMSHKLRTPLNSILGFSQILGMGNLDERQKKNLQHINNGGKELLNMVDDILEINNIDNIRMNISTNKFSLNKVVMHAIEKQQQKISEKNIAIKLNEKPVPEISIRSDLQLLEKVIQNLLENAVRYNKDNGEIKIQIEKVVENEKSRDSFQVSFYDTGIGISPEEQPKIFDIFLTADSGINDAENTGLGLTMAKKIVEKLGGSIGVHSQLGIGSHFWIKLPVDVEVNAPDQDSNTLPMN